MTGARSAPDLLVLHAVRLAGVADAATVARRYGLDLARTQESLLDHQARGWVTWTSFAGAGGWSLTDAGRAEGERRLAAELAAVTHVDGRGTVRQALGTFLPLNARLQRACTRWQLRPSPRDPLALNDHTDPSWDRAVLDELALLGREVGPLEAQLTAVLDRFGGYDARFSAALGHALAGDTGWVDGVGQDSCHAVWFELHEDLLATLGLQRG